MGVAGGVRNLPWLFVGTLAGMILLNLPFGWLVKKLPRSRFIPLTYRFFALSCCCSPSAMHLATPEQAVWVGRIFFIWVSVSNLFAISVFWQLNVDLFSPEQGKRLFGFIAAGATIGAIVGSADDREPGASWCSPTVLLVGAAVLFEVAVFCVGRLGRLSPVLHLGRATAAAATDERPVGGGVLAGFVHAFRSPYLLGVSAFLLLYSVTSTFVYSQQARSSATTSPIARAQTVFFSNVNLGVNSVALVLQLFFTGRHRAHAGRRGGARHPAGAHHGGVRGAGDDADPGRDRVFQVVRRGVEYAVTRPAREVIYTVVSREDRYKSKGFIDTFVYRLGDQVGAWAMAPLNGVGARAASLVAIGVAALWLLNALWLGRRQQSLEAAERQRVMAGAPAD